jgi:hypothetical protein
MHYTDKNFKTKKQLKEAVAARLAYLADSTKPKAHPVTVFNPESFSGEAPTPDNGTVCVGGPHYPQPHVWYSTVTLKGGEVVKVK